MTFGLCPLFLVVCPTFHKANNTHRLHTSGFYYGAPWHAATRNNVFFTGEACLAPTFAPLAQSRNVTLFFALKGQYNLA